MAVYAIAALKFTDRDAYSRYQAALMDVFQRYSGTPLAVDEAPLLVEGKWERQGPGVGRASAAEERLNV